MSDPSSSLQLFWTSDAVGQPALLVIFAGMLLASAFIYQPLVARLLRLRALDRGIGSDRTRYTGDELEDRRAELDAAFLGSLLAEEWREFQRRWLEAALAAPGGARKGAVEVAPVRLLDTVKGNLLPRSFRVTLLGCLPGSFFLLGLIGASISFSAGFAAPDAAFGVQVAGAITVAIWGFMFAGLAAFANRLLEAAFVAVGESLDQAAERAFGCVTPVEVATRSVRAQRDVVDMLPAEVNWMTRELARVLDEGLVRIERSTADAASLVSEEQRGSLRDLVQELSTSVRRGVERHLGGLNAALQRTVEHQDQITGGIALNYERMVETAKTVAPVARALEDAAGAVTTASASIGDSAEHVRPALELLVDTGKTLEAAAEHIGRAQDGSAASIDDIRAALVHASDAVAEQKQLVDIGLRETRAMVDGLREGIGRELSTSLSNIDQALTGAVAQLRAVIEDSHRTVTQLGAPIQSAESIAREMHGMLEKTSGDVAGLGQWLTQAVEPVAATLARIDGRTGQVARVLESFAGQGQVLEQSVEALKGGVADEARGLRDASAALATTLEQATEAIASLGRSGPESRTVVAARAEETPPPTSPSPEERPKGGFIQRATRITESAIASPERHLAAERAHEERVARRRDRKARAAREAREAEEAAAAQGVRQAERSAPEANETEALPATPAPQEAAEAEAAPSAPVANPAANDSANAETGEVPAASPGRLSSLVSGRAEPQPALSETAAFLSHSPDWSSYSHTFRKRSAT